MASKVIQGASTIVGSAALLVGLALGSELIIILSIVWLLSLLAVVQE